MIEKNENYTSYMVAGLVMALLLIGSLGMYSFRETGRLASAAERFGNERVTRGSEIYQTQCVACHGATGEGGVGPALNNRTVLKNTLDSVFLSVIRSGVPGTQMPAWSVDFGGPLTDEDVRDLVALLRSWEPMATEITPQQYIPDAARGASVFANTCAACHGSQGEGGIGLALRNNAFIQSQTNAEMLKFILAGRPGTAMAGFSGRLDETQVTNVIAFLRLWQGAP